LTHSIAGVRTQISDPEAVIQEAHRWGTAHAAEAMLADARLVFGADHLETAARHAERARDSSSMITRSVAMETLLYLSGQGQVSEAIRLAGIRIGSTTVAICVFGSRVDNLIEALGWTRDDSVLDAQGKSLRALGISPAEEATVPQEARRDLALERTALLDAFR
jgi:KEOPS complex subunit Cgi121